MAKASHFFSEACEKTGLLSRFDQTIANAWAMVYRSLKFDGFNYVVTKVASVFALVIQAPRLFAQRNKTRRYDAKRPSIW